MSNLVEGNGEVRTACDYCFFFNFGKLVNKEFGLEDDLNMILISPLTRRERIWVSIPHSGARRLDSVHGKMPFSAGAHMRPRGINLVECRE